METTSIRVSKVVRGHLVKKMRGTETFDQVLRRLLRLKETAEKKGG